MGIFSSKYKYYAYAGSSYLLPAEDREHTVKSLMLQAQLSGTATLAEAVKMGLQTDMYRRSMRMAKYAADEENGYPFGFPSVDNTSFYLPWADLEPIIEDDLGYGIDVNAYYMSVVLGREYFWIEEGIKDNYLSWFTGDPPAHDWYYFPDEIEIPVVNPDTGAYYLADNKNYETVLDGNNVTLTWHYEDKDGAPQTWESPVYTVSIPTEGTWIMVRYKVTAEPTNWDYWFYQVESGVNPTLEALIEKREFLEEYLPIAILMHDTVWFDEEVPEDLVLEKGLDRILKYLSLDPVDIKEDFLDSIENPDPDTPPEQIPKIEDIWDFFVHFSMPLRTIDRAARDYLWHFYQHLKTRTWTTFDDYQSWCASGINPLTGLFGLEGNQPFSEMSMQEGEEYTGYIARYAWSYISDRTENGRFTPPGWTRPLKDNEAWSHEYARPDADYSFGLELVHGGTFTPPGGGGDYLLGPSSKIDGVESAYTIVVRQKKLSENDGVPSFNAILVMGPSMEYQINTSKEPVGVGQSGYVDYRYRFVDCLLFPEDPEQDSEFRWPIHIASLKNISAMRRESALQEALAATVFLVDEVKVKWYQTGFFKWLIIIIVVVIIILAQQYQLLGTVQGMASAAFAAGATGTAIALAALYVTLVFAMGFLISFAGSLIGGTWGKIFMLAAALYMAGGVNIFSNVGTSWGNMVSNFGWGTASNFLTTIRPFIDMGRLIVEERALAKLESDMRDFTKTAREKSEELRDAWDQLGEQPSWLNPMDLAGALKAQWYVEKPDTYFARTLNANPGILGYDVVNNFVDMALFIPQDGNPGDFVTSMLEDMAKQRGAA